jgi:F-type H+-transporting ATPase subunit b
VADLTVIATEKVTRKSLDDDDHRRLIEETLKEFDFEALSPSTGGRASRPSGSGSNGGSS